jgi:ElaB/YqjD/DUF883 family membrane-anchored ribosome-binding protein
MSIFPNQSNHLSDQAAQAADDAIKSTQRATNEALDSLAETVQDLRHEAAPLLNRASAQASALARHGRDAVSEQSRHLREQARLAADSTTTYIQNAPVQSVLMAAAAGAALMALMSLLSRPRH